MPYDAKSYWRQKDEQARITRGYESGFNDRYGNKIQKEATETPAAEAAATEGRSFGFRSGAASAAPGGIANQRFGEAVEAGKSLGEPTSFRGGAGAPTPVGVIRGMRQTFATDTGGPQMSEFATPEQAGQAWNRGQRAGFIASHPTREGLTYPPGTSPEEQATKMYGSWRPPGETLAELPAKEGPGETQERMMRGEAFAQKAGQVKREEQDVLNKKVTGEFDSLMHESPYSTFDTKSKRTVFQAKDESQYRDYLDAKNHALQQGNAAAGRQRFEDRQMVRQWLQTQRLQPGTNMDALIDAGTRNPETWQGLVEDAKKVLKISQPARAIPPAPWYQAESEGLAKGFVGP